MELPIDGWVFEVRNGVFQIMDSEPVNLGGSEFDGHWHFARGELAGPFATRKAAMDALMSVVKTDVQTAFAQLEREGVIRKTGGFRGGKPVYTRTGKELPVIEDSSWNAKDMADTLRAMYAAARGAGASG